MRLTPAELANVVLRNAVPVIGLTFYHWSAANLVILYFVRHAARVRRDHRRLLYSQFPAEEAEGFAARLNTIGGYVAGAAILALILAVPLGMPVYILVFGSPTQRCSTCCATRHPAPARPVGDRCRSCRTATSSSRRGRPIVNCLKRRKHVGELRWIGLMIAAYFPLTHIAGRSCGCASASVRRLPIFTEIQPDRIIAAFGRSGAHIAGPAAAQLLDGQLFEYEHR